MGIFLLTGLSVQAKQDSAFIEVNHTIWGLRIKEDAQRIKLREATRSMEQVPEAYNVMKGARTKYRQSQWLGVGAGLAIVYSLGTRHATVEHQVNRYRVSYNPISAGIGIVGIGLAVVAFRMEKHAVKEMQDAASIYNQARSRGRNEQGLSWQLIVQPSGAGIAVSF